MTGRRLEEIDLALQSGAAPDEYLQELLADGSLASAPWLARLSHCLLLTGQWPRAVAAAQLAAAQSPDLKYQFELGTTLSVGGEFLAVLDVYKKAIQRSPDDVRSHYALAQAWHLLQQMDEALDEYNWVLERKPDLVEAISYKVVALNYRNDDQESLSEGGLLAESRRYGQLLGGATRELPKTWEGLGEPPRPLRVGILSPEMREHSVSYFLLPIVERCPPDVELYMYHDTVHVDAVTERYKAHATGWRSVPAASNDALEKLMLDDKLDVALDLNGHFSRGRLAVFAHRVAPVQAAYLGYPNTTGVSAMDWRIGDATIDCGLMQGAQDTHWTERLALMERGMFAYQPPECAPPVTEGPATPTFGYFGHLGKISQDTAETWAELLGMSLDYKLIIKGDALGNPGMRAMWVKKFEGWGLPMDRVELREKTRDTASHLAMYGDVSVALDTWPYNGTTTICEALWMGVPVVTMRGSRHASKVAASLISGSGVVSGIAHDRQDYVELAMSLAQRPVGHRRARVSRADLAGASWLQHDAVADEFWSTVRQIAGQT